jgi:hypothetical protein
MEGKECEPSANNVPAETVKDSKKVKEEVILCPDCKKDPCTCKGVKESFEPIVEGVLKNKIVMAYDNYKHKKLNKVDFEKLRNSMIQIAANAKTIKDLDVLDRDVDFSIAELEKMKRPENEEKVTFHIEFLNNEYKKFLAEKRVEMNKQKCVESFVDKLDNYCDKLSHIIETHELARNSVIESLTYEIEDQTVFVPYIQPNDCNLSNLEFAYKTKLVCESLKSELKNVNNENDFIIIEKAVDMNLQSIQESLNVIKDMEKMEYKQNTLKSCENYLNKIKHVIDNNVAPNNPVVESTSVFGSDDDVERIFNRVKEYTLIESTNNDLMETVMAESIVEYTILEAFNTLNLLKFDKNEVRRMSRNNISCTTEGFFGFGKKVGNKQKNKLSTYNGNYGEIVDNKDKYLQLYEKSLKNLVNVVQRAFPGCELYEDGGTDNHKEKEYENVILIDKFKPIINLEKNFDLLKKLDKQGLFKNCNSIDDVDGEKMMGFLDKNVFKKMSGFKETEGSYGMYYHKDFEGLAIFCDEDFERISISLKLPYKK